MKRVIYLLLIAIVSMSFCACDSNDDPDKHVDNSPALYKFTFIVTDQDGNDFLTDDNYGLLEGKVKLTFHGTDYILQDYHKNDVSKSTARAMIDDEKFFHIARSTQISGEYRYYIHFGLFDPLMVYHNEPISVTWPDGTVDNITFTWNRDKSIEQSTINGEINEYYNYFFLKKDVKSWNLGF